MHYDPGCFSFSQIEKQSEHRISLCFGLFPEPKSATLTSSFFEIDIYSASVSLKNKLHKFVFLEGARWFALNGLALP